MLANRLQPGAPSYGVGLPDTRRIRNRLCKCGKQKTLPTFAQPRRRLRAEFAAKFGPELSHLLGLTEESSSTGRSVGAYRMEVRDPHDLTPVGANACRSFTSRQ